MVARLPGSAGVADHATISTSAPLLDVERSDAHRDVFWQRTTTHATAKYMSYAITHTWQADACKYTESLAIVKMCERHCG